MLKRVVALLGCFAVLTGCTTPAPDSSVANLSSPEPDVRIGARDQIMQDRVDLIRNLVVVAEETHTEIAEDAPAALAIDLLGFSRAEEATAWLVSHIAYEQPGDVLEDMEYGEYPCLRALIAIGLPAVREILGRPLERVPDEHLELYALVLRRVEGQEWARRRLEAEIDDRPEEAREGLRRLLEILNETA